MCEALIWKIEELRPYVVRELFDCLPLLIPNEKRRVLTDIVEKRLSEFLEICTASDVLSVLKALAYGGVNSDKLKDESSRNGVVFSRGSHCYLISLLDAGKKYRLSKSNS